MNIPMQVLRTGPGLLGSENLRHVALHLFGYASNSLSLIAHKQGHKLSPIIAMDFYHGIYNPRNDEEQSQY